MITKRNTDFNMQEKAVPADGVITGYGFVNSNLGYIYSCLLYTSPRKKGFRASEEDWKVRHR